MISFTNASRKLLSDFETGLKAATDLRERIEIVHTMEYSNFLKALFPAFRELLENRLKPRLVDDEQNRFRSLILEILHRLPNNDVLKPYVHDVTVLARTALKEDNEDNAHTCLKIIFDLHKNYRELLKSNAQPVLDIVATVYEQLPQNVQRLFAPSTQPGANQNGTDAGNGNGPGAGGQKTFLRSIESCKVLIECPLIVMLLFQLYPAFIQSNIKHLLPLMVRALKLRAPPNALRMQETRYKEFVACQVKTLSFLTYLLRSYSQLLLEYRSDIATSVITLFLNCPVDAVATKRELLIATRHILATEFREGFKSHVDKLLDERTVFGVRRHAPAESLRPLAYSTLADFVHYVRGELTLRQLAKVVHIFGRNIHDSSLPLSIQVTSVRLLLNVIDYIFHKHTDDPQKGKVLLQRILKTLTTKVDTLGIYIPLLYEDETERKTERRISEAGPAPLLKEMLGLQAANMKREALRRAGENVALLPVRHRPMAPKKIQWHRRTQEEQDVQKDLRSLLRTIILGLKTVFWCILNYGKANNQGDEDKLGPKYSFSPEERELAALFFRSGLRTCQTYCRLVVDTEGEAKDMLENFAGAFTVLDAYNFKTTVGESVPLLVTEVARNETLFTIAQHLLANSNVSAAFAQVLLDFLLPRIHLISVRPGEQPPSQENEEKRSDGSLKQRPASEASILLRLFKITFGSVTLFHQNEEILRPHLQNIVWGCLRHCAICDAPGNFFVLLRSLFRSISGGKFENSYGELKALLPVILTSFLRLYRSAVDETIRSIIIELSLIIPSKLSYLLPHLPLLMHLMLEALRSEGELVNLGIRTFEFWVDNLNPDFLYSILEQDEKLLTEVMLSIASHLRPAPYPYGMLALRLLGKLGGKNRRFLGRSLALERGEQMDGRRVYQVSMDAERAAEASLEASDGFPSDRFNLRFQWNGGEDLAAANATPSFALPLDGSVNRAVYILRRANEVAILAKTGLALPVKYGSKSRAGPLPEVKGVPQDAQSTGKATCFHATLVSSFQLLRQLLAQMIPPSLHSADFKICTSAEERTGLQEAREVYEKGGYIGENHATALLQRDKKALMEVMRGLMLAISVDVLETGATPVFIEVCRLSLKSMASGELPWIPARMEQNPSVIWRHRKRSCSAQECKGTVSMIFLVDILAEETCAVTGECTPWGIRALQILVQCVRELDGYQGGATIAHFQNMVCLSIYDAFISILYRGTWRQKTAAFKALQRLAVFLPRETLRQATHVLLDGLFFALQETPLELATSLVDEATKVIDALFPLVQASTSVQPSPPGSLADAAGNPAFQRSVVKVEERDLSRGLPQGGAGSSSANAMIDINAAGEVARSRLCPNLASSGPFARLLAQYATKRVCTMLQIPIHILLRPLEMLLEEKLSAKRLLGLTLPAQLGILDSMVYYIGNTPKVSRGMENQLLMVLRDTISLADRQMEKDELLMASNWLKQQAAQVHAAQKCPQLLHFAKYQCNHLTTEVASSVPLAMPSTIQIRLAAISLIQVVHHKMPELIFAADETKRDDVTPQAAPSLVLVAEERKKLFHSYVKLLVKNVSGRSEGPVVNMATVTLHQIVVSARQRKDGAVPHAVLQSCMKPLLEHLSDYKRLTLPALKALARLLELFSNWFHEKLGEKLLDHLKAWTGPDKVDSPSSWKTGEELLIAASLIDLFHLLPPHLQFMDNLVKTTMMLEAQRPKYLEHGNPRSPFREPLLRYLIKLPEESLKYFINPERLRYRGELYSATGGSDQQAITYASLFQELIRLEVAQPLRQALSTAPLVDHLLRVCMLEIYTSVKQMHAAEAARRTSSTQGGVAAQQQPPRLEAHGSPRMQGGLAAVGTAVPSASDGSVTTAGPGAALARPTGVHGSAPRQAAVKPEQNAKMDALDPSLLELHYQGLLLIRTLGTFDPTFIPRNRVVLDCIRIIWRSVSRQTRLKNEDHLNTRHQDENRILVECFLCYCRERPEHVEILFDMLSIFIQPTVTDFTFLQEFYATELPRTYSAANKKEILWYWLGILMEPTIHEELRVLGLQRLITPMLAYTFAEKKHEIPEIIDGKMIQEFMKTAYHSSRLPHYSEPLKIELLKLATLLIEHLGDELIDHRRELIKFAWNHLKADDSFSKKWAYVNVCRFIAVYETPAKIILQVYVALLRTFQPDDRGLVRAALDILVPALQDRLDADDFYKSLRWTRKIMYEDGHTLPQLVHMWHLITRHPTLFYSYRVQFVPQMVNSLNRVGLPPSTHIENRHLAIGLVDLILSWEQHRRDRIKLKQEAGIDDRPSKQDDRSAAAAGSDRKRKLEAPEHPPEGKMRLESGQAAPVSKGEHPAPGGARQGAAGRERAGPDGRPHGGNRSGSSAEDDFKLSPSMVELITNFLVRISLFASDNKDENVVSLTPRCIRLLRRTLQLWEDANIKVVYFEKIIHMSQSEQSPSPSLYATCLDILNEVLSAPSRPNPFFLQHVQKLQVLVLLCFEENSEKVVEKLALFLKQVGRLYPARAPPLELSNPKCQFYNRIKRVMEDHLNEALNHVSHSSSKSSERSSKDTKDSKSKPSSGASAQDAATKSYAPYRVVKVLKAMCESMPEYVENHVSVICKLFQKLGQEHVKLSTQAQQPTYATVPSPLGDAGAGAHTPKVMATPSCAVLGEFIQVKPSYSYVSRAYHGSAAAVLRGEKTSQELETLLIIIELLGALVRLNKLSDWRRSFINVLSSCVEKSMSIRLLLKVMEIIAEWLFSTRSILTQKEKISFLGRMMGLDRLPEFEAQVLARRLYSIIWNLCNLAEKDPTKHGWIFEHAANPVLAGMLTAHADLRSRFISIAKKRYNNVSKILCSAVEQDWESVSGRHWVTILVELLLMSTTSRSVTNTGRRRTLSIAAPDTLEVRASFQAFRNAATGQQPQTSTALIRSDEVLMDSMRQLIHADPQLADAHFYVMWPAAWKQISQGLRDGLVEKLVHLLARPYHRQSLALPLWSQKRFGVLYNIVQVWMNTIRFTSPLPSIPQELLGSMAINYGVWFQVLPIMEHHVELTVGVVKDGWMRRLVYMYKQLGLDDTALALNRRFCISPYSQAGLSLERYGYHELAQQTYLRAIQEQQMAEAAAKDKALGSPRKLSVRDYELELWEERWIECSRELCQWSVLKDFAQKLEHPDLMLESGAKSHDWSLVLKTLKAPTTMAEQASGSPYHRLFDIYITLTEGRLDEVEKQCAQCVQIALHKWRILPSPLMPTVEHENILHLFHQLVELRESGQIMLEVRNHASKKTYPDLKNVLTSWRDRLPNDWEPVHRWDSLFFWRNQVFETIAKAFQWGEASKVAFLHDTPWTVIKQASIARHQHMQDVSLQYLAKLQGVSTMDVEDAFDKLREQIVICMNYPKEMHGGLNMINNTNLEYFNEKQKSELFRLKAEFYRRLGQSREAFESFGQAAALCPKYGKAWLTWGEYCDTIFQGNQQTLEYAVHALACYLQAVAQDPTGSRMVLARALWLLSRDDGDLKLAQCFEFYGSGVPEWCWILWIPQLLSNLCRPYGRHMTSVLQALCLHFPQAIYCTLRAFLLERREVRKLERSSLEKARTPNPSESCTGDLMSVLRRNHPVLGGEIESILEEIIVQFRPVPEEELLSAMQALLSKSSREVDIPGAAQPPEPISAHLYRIQMKFFPASTESRKHSLFVKEYKALFEADFGGSGASVSKMSFAEVIARLRKWKRILLHVVPASGQTVPLHACSRQLAQLHIDYNPWAGCSGTRGGGLTALEIPGLYQGSLGEPRPDLHAKVQRFCPAVTFLTTNGQTFRRLALLGSDGRAYHFDVQFATAHATRAHERAIQLYAVVNQALEANALARNAHLYTVSPSVVPITPRTRLQEALPGSCTLQTVYESFCGAEGKDPDHLIFATRHRVQEAKAMTGGTSNEGSKEQGKKLETILQTSKASDHASSEALLRYLLKTVRYPSEVWLFRNKFATQLGLASMLHYVLSGSDQSPPKVRFDPRTGHVFGVDLRPSYSEDGSLDASCSVPFRLTDNLSALLGPVVIDGAFIKAMAAGAGALREKSNLLRPYYALTLRDDLQSCQALKFGSYMDPDLQTIDGTIRERVERNALAVDAKVRDLAPQVPAEKSNGDPMQRPDQKARQLTTAAGLPQNLCRMDPMWMAWV